MPWFMTPYGPQHVIEPGTIDEFERRDYTVMTAQQAADYFAGVAFPDPPSFATEAEVPGIMATVAADAGSAFSVAQRAALVAPSAIRVADYGTLGTADDSATINAALAAANGRRLIFPPNVTLNTSGSSVSGLSNAVIDGNGCTLQLTGVGATAITLATGTYSNLEIRNLRIKGSAVDTDAHVGINAPSGGTFTDTRVIGNHFQDVTIGASFNADGSGSVAGLLLQGNYLKNIVGTASGAGYGLHWAISDTTASAAIRCIGNTIVSAQRHAIYSGKARGVLISGNQVFNHRSANRTSDIRSAINIARSLGVTVTGNTVLDSAGGAIYLGGPEGATLARNYVVTGNTFSGATDGVQLVTIGQQSPSTEGTPDGIVFVGNLVERSNGDGACMTVLNGLNVRVTGNLFRITGTTSVSTMIAVNGTGDSAGGRTYTDNVAFAENTFVTAGTGDTNPVRLSGAELLRSRLTFRNNMHLSGASGPGDFFVVSVASDNPNIDVQGQPRDGLVFTGGVFTARLRLGGPVQTAAPSAGGAGALPATPTGYVTMNVNGTDRVIPYY